MSDKLPRIPGQKMKQLLEAYGFTARAAKGSHTFYRDEFGHTTIVAVHGSEALPITTIAKILRDIGMSHDEYRDRVKSL